MKIFLTIVLVVVVWNAVITTIQFMQQRKRRMQKKPLRVTPRVGDAVRILSGKFNGYLGRVKEIGANHNNDGFYCWVITPGGAQQRFIYPDEIRVVLE